MIRARKTIRQRSVPTSDSLGEDLHPVLRRVYMARGISDARQLDRRINVLHKPGSMQGIDRAAQRLATAVQSEESILIVGDFDADGATGTAVAIR